MASVKQIVCLANSRKLSGRCIAGREWNAERSLGEWVRPVSARENREVSEHERQYRDGSDPRVLDIVRVPVIKPQPEEGQNENWLLDADRYWQRAGRYPWWNLRELLDPPELLWLDGFHTYSGRNDKVPSEHLANVSTSLRLIHVDRLELAVFAPGEAFGSSKRRVQGRFSHAGADYRLWVTDPGCERAYLGKLDGSYTLGARFLTINLGEPYGDAAYKLIAAVIAEDGGSGAAR